MLQTQSCESRGARLIQNEVLVSLYRFELLFDYGCKVDAVIGQRHFKDTGIATDRLPVEQVNRRADDFYRLSAGQFDYDIHVRIFLVPSTPEFHAETANIDIIEQVLQAKIRPGVVSADKFAAQHRSGDVETTP